MVGIFFGFSVGFLGRTEVKSTIHGTGLDGEVQKLYEIHEMMPGLKNVPRV